MTHAVRTLVIGAGGNIGSKVVAQLRDAGLHVRALTRNPETARFSAGVEVARGDLTIPDSLDAPLEGIDAVFLVWTAPPATVVSALERITNNARRVVLLSSPYKTAHPFFQASQPNQVSALHAHIEELIAASGVEWTFLRPGMLASNALFWWAPQVRAGDLVRWPYLAAPTAPIDERDIASVAIRAVCADGHAGAEYILTGPESLTQFEQILTVGRAIGRSLHIEEIAPDEARREWQTFMPAPVANMLLDSWAAAIGQPAFVTSTVAEITGAPARTFLDWAIAHVADFRA